MKGIATVVYDSDSDEYVLQFPDDIIERVGWQSGDTLLWAENDDGSFTLSKNLYK